MSNDLSFLENILYHLDDIQKIVEAVKAITNSEHLHIFATHYNWDNGFEVPETILHHPECDFGTALMLFYLAEGYSYLMNEVMESSPSKKFLDEAYVKIDSFNWVKRNISYEPDLTKIQKYKLQKIRSELSSHFIEKTPGKTIISKL